MSSGGWHINSEQEVHRKSTPHLMIYETEEACMKKKAMERKHAVTVIQARWVATCCFCNTVNYPQGVFSKEYNLASMLYWRGRWRVTGKK